MRAEFIQALGETFSNEREAQALLDDVRFPEGRRPVWASVPNAEEYWRQVVRLVERGIIEDGNLHELARTAARMYPGNEALRAARDDSQIGGPSQQAQGPPTSPDGEHTAPDEEHQVLFLLSEEGHSEFLQLVRDVVDDQARLYYSSEGQAAVGISRSAGDRMTRSPGALDDLRRRVAAELGSNAELTYQVLPFRPYLYQSLEVRGPDHQRFEFSGVPSSTPVRDIPEAMLPYYSTDVSRDRQTGRARPTVVDHVRADGTVQRLDPEQTLHQSGVEDGDQLDVLPQSTAGVGDLLRQQAVARAKVQVRRFGIDHGIEIETDFDDFPTEYRFQFTAPGFAPPEPGTTQPVPTDEHRVLIRLPAQFPNQAPQVYWRSPIFHPNIAREALPDEPEKLYPICLGPLAEQYTPDLDFRELCELLVDIAAYRNYEIWPHNSGGEGYLNEEAAAWARSLDGQLRIAARGGDVRLLQLGPERRPRPLRVRRLDVLDVLPHER